MKAKSKGLIILLVVIIILGGMGGFIGYRYHQQQEAIHIEKQREKTVSNKFDSHKIVDGISYRDVLDTSLEGTEWKITHKENDYTITCTGKKVNKDCQTLYNYLDFVKLVDNSFDNMNIDCNYYKNHYSEEQAKKEASILLDDLIDEKISTDQFNKLLNPSPKITSNDIQALNEFTEADRKKWIDSMSEFFYLKNIKVK